jgi:hypothetical protein
MGQLLADPVAEARQLIRLATEQGLVMRALGGVAVFLQSADGQPRLLRSVKDIDLAVAKGIDAEPQSRRGRMRNQVGGKIRWYAEPEQEQSGGE